MTHHNAREAATKLMPMHISPMERGRQATDEEDGESQASGYDTPKIPPRWERL